MKHVKKKRFVNRSDKNEFPCVLKQLLQHHSLSFRKFAKALGMTHAPLARLATGKNPNPNMKTLSKLAKFFNISISQLIGEESIDFERLPKNIIDYENNDC